MSEISVGARALDQIQSSLLPQAADGDGAIAGVNLPAREVSGDFFDYFPLSDGRICFCLGDVSGKGMNAALLMAKTASLYRCLGKAVLSPGRLLAMVNREICETAARGMFVTMVGGIFDPRTGVVKLANAGHEPPLLLTPEGEFQAFEADGPPLGIIADPPTKDGYPETEIKLNGGSLWIFTDGVTEGYIDGEGTELGDAGVKRILMETGGKPLMERLETVVGVIKPGEYGMRDDVTLLGVVDDVAARPAAEVQAASAAAGSETVMFLRLPARAVDWLPFVVFGAIGNLAPFTLIAWGQQHVPSAVAAILMAAMPLFTLVLARVAKPAENPITAGRVAGIALGFSGVVVLVGPSALTEAGGGIGELAILGAALCYAVASLYAERVRHVPPLVSATATLTST